MNKYPGICPPSPATDEVYKPTTSLRFNKRKVRKLHQDGTPKYFRILQQLHRNDCGDEIWQDIPVVEERSD